jgi:hypothetical protein
MVWRVKSKIIKLFFRAAGPNVFLSLFSIFVYISMNHPVVIFSHGIHYVWGRKLGREAFSNNSILLYMVKGLFFPLHISSFLLMGFK